jgi:hypothetical protein
MRSAADGPPSDKKAASGAKAASTCCSSFMSCKACSGVLLRSRWLQRASRLGAEVGHERRWGGSLQEDVDAAAIEGSLCRRCSSSCWNRRRRRAPSAAADKDARGPICGFMRPLTNRALSICSASRRKRGRARRGGFRHRAPRVRESLSTIDESRR